MPRHKTISISKNVSAWSIFGRDRRNDTKRTYRLTLIDDAEERREAVFFFKNVLFPSFQLPDGLEEMSEFDAQKYLDENPIQEQWRMLTLDSRVEFSVDDLFRLKHLPELEAVHSHVDFLTDEGVELISQISGLKRLLVYSPLVTNKCLQYILQLQKLQAIDLQGSHQITRKAFDELVERLPCLENVYAPFDRPLTELIKEIERKGSDIG